MQRHLSDKDQDKKLELTKERHCQFLPSPPFSFLLFHADESDDPTFEPTILNVVYVTKTRRDIMDVHGNRDSEEERETVSGTTTSEISGPRHSYELCDSFSNASASANLGTTLHSKATGRLCYLISRETHSPRKTVKIRMPSGRSRRDSARPIYPSNLLDARIALSKTSSKSRSQASLQRHTSPDTHADQTQMPCVRPLGLRPASYSKIHNYWRVPIFFRTAGIERVSRPSRPCMPSFAWGVTISITQIW